MNKKLIIGIVGQKGSGKSVVGNYLLSKGFNLMPFAKTLKDMCSKMGFPDEYIYGNQKEEIYAPLGISGRHAMQTLGTEWGRKCLADDIWIRINMHKVMLSKESVVIDDVRFQNEANAIEKEGGILIKIIRHSLKNNDPQKELPFDPHISEQELQYITCDHVIINDGMVEDLVKKLNDIIDEEMEK